MREVPIVADFNMSQSDLVTVSFEKQLFMVRDAKELEGRGIPLKRITDFKGQITDFTALPTDGELDQTKQEATDRKDAAQRDLITQLQIVMGIVGTVDKPSTSGYKKFGTAGLDNASEGDLHLGIIRAVRVGRASLDKYAAKGLTADLLTELETRNATFLTRLGEQQDAETARGEAADARIRAANALYAELMDICGTGKALYAQTNARKFDDYIVNDTEPADVKPEA
ncbi:hypothetical protein Q5H93_17415 [Hymenobacter sp. ASUV-10]|uniref:Uncharacterized protein n=1 Tax=Hymenobacter aranciens TaxID=3063996 RepID=A0ABT9BE81_9BACT|nr:hypothetical protein [Hymenobacter sp. ASUV-10]MDO7876527.1 hypothetical protein [Hymenobacter sp. ASUV-10]